MSDPRAECDRLRRIRDRLRRKRRAAAASRDRAIAERDALAERVRSLERGLAASRGEADRMRAATVADRLIMREREAERDALAERVELLEGCVKFHADAGCMICSLALRADDEAAGR